MTSSRCLALLGAALVALIVGTRDASPHAGPPYPIVSQQETGPFRISVWTDPDTTDDGSAGGQFWVILEPAAGGDVPPDLPVEVSIRPLSRPGEARTARAEPVDGDPSRQFAALVMDHEGPFAVQVSVPAPGGPLQVRAQVEATYDLRPPPGTALVYLVPFLLVGGLWIKLLVRRRRGGGAVTGGPDRPQATRARQL